MYFDTRRQLIYVSIAIFVNVVFCCGASGNNKGKPAKVLSLSVYQQVAQATEALQQENYALALEKLENLLLKGKRLTDYDKAKIYQLQMSVYLGKGDYSASIDVGETALGFNALGSEEVIFMHSQLFYLHFFVEQVDQALAHLQSWFALDANPGVDALFAAAQLYASIEENSLALGYAEKGLALALSSPDINVTQDWFQLVISLNLRLGRLLEASQLLSQAVARWPQKLGYFLQLTAIYHELKREKLAYAVLSLAYRNQLLEKGSELQRLTQYYRYFEYPDRGASILRLALEKKTIVSSHDNLQLLSQTWMQAREWQSAEGAMLKAAEISLTGESWLTLCQLAFQEERWYEAQDYCASAIQRGSLSQMEASTWYLLALAQYYDNKLSLARESFEHCALLENAREDCKYWAQKLQDAGRES